MIKKERKEEMRKEWKREREREREAERIFQQLPNASQSPKINGAMVGMINKRAK